MERLKRYSLLYIEDDPLIRQNAVEYLARYSDTVWEASDGEEGWERYLSHRPDIVISDIKMPKMSGLEMVEKIRRTDSKTPVILITAHTNTEYLLQAIELHLVKYLVKPVTHDKLQEALGTACDMLETKEEQILYLDTAYRYDRTNKTLFNRDKIVRLTHNELLFFDLLASHIHRVVTYEEIERHIWSYEGMSMDALRSLVRSIRKKLPENLVENLSGVGYRLTIDR